MDRLLEREKMYIKLGNSSRHKKRIDGITQETQTYKQEGRENRYRRKYGGKNTDADNNKEEKRAVMTNLNIERRYIMQKLR